jgi:hypothetical protein
MVQVFDSGIEAVESRDADEATLEAVTEIISSSERIEDFFVDDW